MVLPAANRLQAKFLEDLTEELFPPRQHSELQKLCFQLRFHPSNWDDEHGQIAAKISKELNGGFSENSINPTVGAVVEKLKDKFESQMQDDGVDTKKLNPGRGQPKESPWEIVYKWLWETEFPRRGWQLSKEIAICAIEQLQMKPIQKIEAMRRGLDLDEIEICEETIQKGQRYGLQVDLQQDGYLLLVNEGMSGEKYCICPSKAYYLESRLLPTTSIYIPQQNAPAKSLRFTEVGEEYFLAIVTEQPLNLPWVRPDSNPRDIVISDERLHEIFKLVGQQHNSQVFYKNFVVTD